MDKEFDRFTKITSIAILVIGIIAIALLCFLAPSVAIQEKPAPAYTIDATDEQHMHDLGIPTKKDVEMYLEVGRWGYSTENVMHTEHVYTALPGKEEAWCELYGIEVR